MREIYHCTPQELDLIDIRMIDLHREFLLLEAKEKKVRGKLDNFLHE